MKKVKLIITILFFSTHLFSQLYTAKKGCFIIYVDIKGDTARKEIFSDNHHVRLISLIDDELLFKKKNDTIYSHSTSYIINKKTKYTLNTKILGRNKKIILQKCKEDHRDLFRKQGYQKRRLLALYQLHDSISYKNDSLSYGIVKPLSSFNTYNLSYNVFVKMCDSLADSIKSIFVRRQDPNINYLYQKADSINSLDSLSIYMFLEGLDYQRYYAKYFLYKLSEKKPELLISYINRNPNNKNKILYAIRYHKKLEEIIQNIKQVPISCRGKKEIQKQKSKLTSTNILTGVTYVGIIIAEIAIITLIIVALTH